MLLIPCPWCGERSEVEFAYGGEADISRPPSPESMSDGEWGVYVYYRKNPKGTHREMWHHIHGCGRYFDLVRDTASNKVYGSSPVGGEIGSVSVVKRV
ncbi:MAG: sarcosine oxidase subunit delta [Alphaproteobacteria bacterium]